MLTDAEGQLCSPVRNLVTINTDLAAARDDGSGLTEVNSINELGFGHARIAQSSAAPRPVSSARVRIPQAFKQPFSVSSQVVLQPLT
jgi:hypothetical protein